MDRYRNGTGRKVRGTQSVSDTCDQKTGVIYFFLAFVACLGCERRKSRCERQAGGRVACLRCHQMKVRCSFLDGDRKRVNRRLDKGVIASANKAVSVSVSGSGEPTSPISAYLHGDPVDALTMRLNDMERRLAVLELERIQGELLRIKTEPESGPVVVPPLIYRAGGRERGRGEGGRWGRDPRAGRGTGTGRGAGHGDGAGRGDGTGRGVGTGRG